MFNNITVHGTYTLDGYDIMASNQDFYGENVLVFYFRNHNVALYKHTVNFVGKPPKPLLTDSFFN